MSRQVAILHGWSDKSDSFEPLAEFLQGNGYKTVPLFLADYISLRDDVKIDDVAKRMEEVIREKMSLPSGSKDRLSGTFDLIVHSTGGLVARRWISMHYGKQHCPVRNLVMLAPANFGSKLAHVGRSMLGRIFRGVKTRFKTGLETGAEMLHALELSSPFQWDLAQADLFVSDATDTPVFYGPEGVRPFTIVGTHPYPDLISKLINENGSDGTVRVAAANLNAYGRTVDFSGDPRHLMAPEVSEWKKRGGDDNLFPLAVLPDRDHGSIVYPGTPGLPGKPGLSKDPRLQGQLGKLLLQALQTNTANQYADARDAFDAVTAETRKLAGTQAAAQADRDAVFTKKNTPAEYFHEYYQVFVRVEDEFGEDIPDYFLSFMPKRKQNWFSLRATLPKEGVFFHDEVLEDVHVHRRANANRCLFLDRFDVMRTGGFYDQIRAGQPKALSFTVTAADPGDHVAYFARKSTAKRGLVTLHQETPKTARWLKRHSTHFLRIIVPRAADPRIFRLKRAKLP